VTDGGRHVPGRARLCASTQRSASVLNNDPRVFDWLAALELRFGVGAHHQEPGSLEKLQQRLSR